MEINRDNLIVKHSEKEFKPVEKGVLETHMLIVEDNNGSTDYGRGILTFETNHLANNALFCDYCNAYVVEPKVLKFTTSLLAGVTKEYVARLINIKGSSVHSFDSFNSKYANGETVQNNAYINHILAYKQHISMSQDDMNINADTIGYRKDDPDGWGFNAVTGIYNNRLDGAGAGIPINYAINPLFTIENAAKDAVLTQAQFKETGIAIIESDGVAVTPGYYKTYYCYFNQIVLLKDLPFVSKLPLLRGAVMKLEFQLNHATTTLTYTAGVVTGVVNKLSKNTNPIMITQGAIVASDRVETFELSTVSVGGHTGKITKCRLYVNGYVLNPIVTDRFIKNGPKTIVYEDYVVQKYIDIAVGTSFSHVISHSLAGAQQMIICVSLSKDANAGVLPAESVFASEPHTCSPHNITNFQMVIGGKNLYSSNFDYKYEHFKAEMDGVDSLNANLTRGQTSGQIGFKDFTNNYGYIVVDLSKKYIRDDLNSTSYKIMGKNSGLKAIDLTVFVSYIKEAAIDINTGELLGLK